MSGSRPRQKTEAYRLIERAFNYVTVGGMRLGPIMDSPVVMSVTIQITPDNREKVVGVRAYRRGGGR